MISAVVCDDHRLFGESLAAALEGEGARVTVTSNPDETLAKLEAAPFNRVVINVGFPRGDGPLAIRHIRCGWPQIHITCVGADRPELVRSAIDAGAHAVLSKKRPLSELIETVLSASSASRHGRELRHETGTRLNKDSHEGKCPLGARFLTKRERDVLRLLVSAHSTYKIAAELGISVTTTRGYVQCILEKFGVHSRVEAVTYAVRHRVL